MATMRRAGTAVIALALLAATGAACGDDDEGSDATSTTEGSEQAEPIEVTAIDYGYEDLPDSVEAGTRLTLTNASGKELHELVAVLLPADEERSVEDLVKLPQEELEALFAGEPAMVLLAPPSGAEMIPAVGDGTLSEPGRYGVFCAIPVGADPDEYLDAAATSQGGPPEVEGGPPHFTQGMYGELTVE
jgi:hypothetical protein